MKATEFLKEFDACVGHSFSYKDVKTVKTKSGYGVKVAQRYEGDGTATGKWFFASVKNPALWWPGGYTEREATDEAENFERKNGKF